MSKMFQNYDNNIDCDLSTLEPKAFPQFLPLQSASNTSLLCDLKGRLYGVEVRHCAPFTLYLHLEEQHGWDLTGLLADSSIEFKLYNRLNHKVAFEKTFVGSTVFLPDSSDLVLDFLQEELSSLKQESYEISVVLRYPTGFYKLFAEHDGLLVIR